MIAAIVAAVALLCVLPLGFLAILGSAGDDVIDAEAVRRAAQGGAGSPAGSAAQGGAGAPACRWASPNYPPGAAPVGPPPTAVPRTGPATMTITTNHGVIEIVMDRAKTPCTVASFAHLAGSGFFSGTACHRLTTDGIFVVQCGDPGGTGTGGPDYRYADENLPSGAQFTYERGVVALANMGADTNGSQFFISYRANVMQPRYPPFGVVTKGLDIIDRIAAGGVAASGTPGSGTPGQPKDGRPNVPLLIAAVQLS